MTQEEKELLLKDICGRLPYGVKIRTIEIWSNDSNKIETLKDIFIPEDNIPRCGEDGVPIEYIKPYLFPISSMTEEQREELMFISEIRITSTPDRIIKVYKNTIEWFLKNHIDYNNLIGKGLALDATGLNIY